MTAAAIRVAKRFHCNSISQFVKEYDRPGFFSFKFAAIDVVIIVGALIVIAA